MKLEHDIFGYYKDTVGELVTHMAVNATKYGVNPAYTMFLYAAEMSSGNLLDYTAFPKPKCQHLYSIPTKSTKNIAYTSEDFLCLFDCKNQHPMGTSYMAQSLISGLIPSVDLKEIAWAITRGDRYGQHSLSFHDGLAMVPIEGVLMDFFGSFDAIGTTIGGSIFTTNRETGTYYMDLGMNSYFKSNTYFLFDHPRTISRISAKLNKFYRGDFIDTPEEKIVLTHCGIYKPSGVSSEVGLYPGCIPNELSYNDLDLQQTEFQCVRHKGPVVRLINQDKLCFAIVAHSNGHSFEPRCLKHTIEEIITHAEWAPTAVYEERKAVARRSVFSILNFTAGCVLSYLRTTVLSNPIFKQVRYSKIIPNVVDNLIKVAMGPLMEVYHKHVGLIGEITPADYTLFPIFTNSENGEPVSVVKYCYDHYLSNLNFEKQITGAV